MRSSLTISPEFQDLHKEYTNYGQNFAKEQSVIFVGLARDLDSILNESIDRVLSLRSTFSNLDVLIVENDSVDNTKDVLKDYAKKYPNRFNYISDNYGSKKFGTVKDVERTTNLANYRNQYLQYIRDCNKKYDYVIVLDWDFLDFDNDGLLNTFGWIGKTNISAMCGISLRYQNVLSSTHKNYWNYDCWAYRGNWWIDKQKEIDDCNPMLWFGFWIPPIGSPPLKVNSGFGGMCIYRTDDIISSKYEGYDCEHVCLHKNLSTHITNFSLHINPSQIMILS